MAHRVHPKIWQKCAGDSVTVLKLNSRVFYFPRGHLEHACINFPSPEALSLINRCPSYIVCVISDVDLSADSETDELIAKLVLTPVIHGDVVVPLEHSNEDDGDQIVSYAKTLTHSDANNGGALSIPVKCAKSIFPPLDYDAESPSQDVQVTDFHGVVWKFRHVYAGTPKRHLFTHGWSTFADHKKLVSGDTVVFVKNLEGEITVGLRRKMRFVAAAANVTEKAVTEAAELANKNTVFEVTYFPTVGGFDFVVGAKAVEDAMKIPWSHGMNVKYTMKINDDTSKGCSIFHGTISTLSPTSIRPWRMLQIYWNEHGVLNYLAKVNPWQVEPISDSSTKNLYSPPTTKMFSIPSVQVVRLPQNSVLLSDKERNLSIPMTNSSNSSTILNCDTFPNATLETRHNLLSKSTSSNFLKDDSRKDLDNIPPEENIESPVSDDLLSNINDLNPLDPKIASTHNYGNKNVTSRSIKLFGQIVSIDRNDLHDSNINRKDDGKDINEVEDIEKITKK